MKEKDQTKQIELTPEKTEVIKGIEENLNIVWFVSLERPASAILPD